MLCRHNSSDKYDLFQDDSIVMNRTVTLKESKDKLKA